MTSNPIATEQIIKGFYLQQNEHPLFLVAPHPPLWYAMISLLNKQGNAHKCRKRISVAPAGDVLLWWFS